MPARHCAASASANAARFHVGIPIFLPLAGSTLGVHSSRCLGRRLDVRALDAVEIGALEPHQLGQAVALGGVNEADIVEVRITRFHDVGFLRLDQRRSLAVTLLDDAPVGHLGIADRDTIYLLARAVTVRTSVLCLNDAVP